MAYLITYYKGMRKITCYMKGETYRAALENNPSVRILAVKPLP